MTNHRYTQIIVPMDNYVKSLTPRAKVWVSVLECSLTLVLLTSLVFLCGLNVHFLNALGKKTARLFFFEPILALKSLPNR